MPFIPVPQCIQVNVRAELLGIPVENVLNFTVIGSPPVLPGAVQLAAETIGDAWIEFMLPTLQQNYSLLTVYASAQDISTGPTFEWTAPPNSDGAITGEALPGQNALVLTHRTALRGRSYRGRTYICGLGEAQTQGNNVLDASGDAILEGFSSVITAIQELNYFFVVVSRYTNGAPRLAGVATPVLSTSLRNYAIDTQRRRLR